MGATKKESIITRDFVLHVGDINTGKTFASLELLKKSDNGIYLASSDIIAFQVYERLNKEGVACNLISKYEVIKNSSAKHVSCNISELDLTMQYDIAVIDDVFMVEYMMSGYMWTSAILNIKARQIHVCCSLSTADIVKKVIIDCGDTATISYHKKTKKVFLENKKFSFPTSVKENDALITFNDGYIAKAMRELSVQNCKTSVFYKDMPYKTYKKQSDLFLSKKTTTLLATDVIEGSFDLPIMRVVFLDNSKEKNGKIRRPSPREIRRIIGKSGKLQVNASSTINSVIKRDKGFLYNVINLKEHSIEFLYLHPTIEDISMYTGTLPERLLAWKEENNSSLIKKIDITRYVQLYNFIKDYKLSVEEEFSITSIDFDRSLNWEWELHAKNYTESSSFLPPPNIPKDNVYTLTDLMMLLQRVNLYIDFNKYLKVEIDAEYVCDMRNWISEEMNGLLQHVNF